MPPDRAPFSSLHPQHGSTKMLHCDHLNTAPKCTCTPTQSNAPIQLLHLTLSAASRKQTPCQYLYAMFDMQTCKHREQHMVASHVTYALHTHTHLTPRPHRVTQHHSWNSVTHTPQSHLSSNTSISSITTLALKPWQSCPKTPPKHSHYLGTSCATGTTTPAGGTADSGCRLYAFPLSTSRYVRPSSTSPPAYSTTKYRGLALGPL